MNRRPPAVRWAVAVALSSALTLGTPFTGAAQQHEQAGHKSAPLALTLSLVLPGGGQFYNGQPVKGAVVLGGAVLTAWPLLLTASDVLGLDDDKSGTGTHVLGAVGLGLIVWSWIDAPLSAKAINRRLDAGSVGLDLGPRVEPFRAGPGLGLSLLRIEF